MVTSRQQASVRVNLEGKNIGLAYLIWWFLGLFGGHRFYLDRKTTAIVQLCLTVIGILGTIIVFGYLLIFIVAIWWIVDAFLIPNWVQSANAASGLDSSILKFQKAGSKSEDYEALHQLHSLYEKGIITKEQFETRRNSILDE